MIHHLLTNGRKVKFHIKAGFYYFSKKSVKPMFRIEEVEYPYDSPFVNKWQKSEANRPSTHPFEIEKCKSLFLTSI